MIRSIIFDLDGVLVQTENIHMAAAKQAFADFGYALSEQDIYSVIGRHPEYYWSPIAAKYGISESMRKPLLKKIFDLYYELWDAHVVLLPNAAETVEGLIERNITISLATNSSLATVNKFIKRFGFEEKFFAITTGDEVKKAKPDPEIYTIAKEKLPFLSNEIIVIEDSEPGIIAAKDAGLRAAAVANEFTAAQDFSKADYHLKSLTDIFKILEL